MQTLKRAALLSAAAIAMGAAPALAQPIMFSTTGQFTGTGCTAGPGGSCTEGGFVLTFVGNPASIPYLSGTSVDLGSFSIACPSGSCASTAFPAGVTFQLNIAQTSPSGGTNQFVGSISGTLQSDGGVFSNLIWTPTTLNLAIGNVQYRLITDNIVANNTINIPAPSGATCTPAPGCNNPNLTQVKALVTVPEPSTIALMATGFVGLVPMIRRRRR